MELCELENHLDALNLGFLIHTMQIILLPVLLHSYYVLIICLYVLLTNKGRNISKFILTSDIVCW